MGSDGCCPDCGGILEPTPGVDHTPGSGRVPGVADSSDAGRSPGVDAGPSPVPAEVPNAVEGPPWHFWVGVAAAGGYLLWRAVQGVVWLF